jgi:hypothetical protein
MGYLSIQNLYKYQDIFLFRECYAMEKIHGTSAHIAFTNAETDPGPAIRFFSGGTKHETFVKMFDAEALLAQFIAMGLPRGKELVIHGESYGAKEQGMSHTYGTVGKFVAFDVKIGGKWLAVPDAERVVQKFGLEFVHYVKIPATLEAMNIERDAPSVQAIRNGISQVLTAGDEREKDVVCKTTFTQGESCWYQGLVLLNARKREGVVLRPLIEVTLNNDSRVICKHKRDDFMETKTPRPVDDPNKLKVLAEANAVADEWVTTMRLTHVLDKIPDHSMEKMAQIIDAMIEDVLREGAGEIVDSPAVRKAIARKTAELYKTFLQDSIAK